MPPARKREPVVPRRVKAAITYMLEQKPDLQAAAAHPGMSTYELRREMGKPHVRRYALAERKFALDAFCLGSPAALAKVRDQSENGMAVVAAVKAGELLQQGALAAEATAQRRQPGLQIVIVADDGSKRVVCGPPEPPMPLLDVTPVPEAERVPAIPSDADAE
jgi:hypothetical protein